MYGFLAVTVAIIVTLVNSSNFLAGVMGTKPGEVYLGTTHYWEDYFLYLSQFFQGARGQEWLTLNRYTSEATAPSILFWPNVMLGKLGGLLGLTPAISYNLAIMLLSFITLMVLSSLMRRAFPKDKTQATIGFLLAAFSTSFINRIWVDGRPMWYPFQLWKTPNFALDRLGGVPHQIVQTLLFLLAMHAWFFYRAKKVPALLVLLVLLTSLNPVMSAMFLVAAWMAQLLTNPRSKGALVTLVVMSVGVAVTAWYYNLISGQEPHIQSKLWEAGQQIATTPLFMLLSVGPISIVGVIGAWAAMKRGTQPIHLFSIALLAVGYLLYFSSVPAIVGISNSRVLFPALYAAWGILGVLGLEALSTPLVIPVPRKDSGQAPAGIQSILNWILGSSPRMTTVFLSCIFLLISIPTLRWEFRQKLLVKPEERIPLLYLPNEVYAAFTYLESQGSFDDIVLANPASHMDAMVPALAGHTSYTGHPFATIDNDRKRERAMRLFRMDMKASEATQWLRENRIRYLVFTKFDGDLARFRIAYPFLKVLRTSPSATVLASS